MAVAVGSLTFFLVRSLPGDIAYKVAAGRYGDDGVSTEAANAVRAELGLDQPIFEQYLNWLGNLFQFDLGNSLVSGLPVIDEIQHQLGYTALLAVCAVILASFIAIPLGLLAAKKPKKVIDQTSLYTSSFIRAQPVFSLGLILTIVFAIELNWFPVAGFGSTEFLILPVLTLAISLAAVSNRIVRDSAIKVLNSQYYQFAKIKGLKEPKLFLRHGLKNMAIPIIAFTGMQFIGVIEGVIMIESLFAWPGIGHALSHAVFARDIPMLQGTALMMGILFVFINTLTDACCALLDPRGEKVKQGENA
ncbi:ABC transporter permease [Catenovulum sp. 2E275]|uniref:ABC transporter permease n=1 Tax=Catenovulum sp. 2E275 TaxID=2980497 RepID=UPI0021CFB229|nr:ABC transporter permease [Catenovulum sp. 2E275]MCU4676932.1 ABC transporter permease [Catenovulum sp. 2E275]